MSGTTRNSRNSGAVALLRCAPLGCVLVLTLALGRAAADDKPGKVAVPEVELIILSTVMSGDSAGLTYPRVAPDSEVRADLAALQSETGWTLRNVNISKGSVTQGSGNMMTSAEFTMTGAVDRAAGGFRLAPIAKALRKHKLVEVVYFVQPPFEFRGLRSFKNEDVSVSLVESTETTYRYRILVANPNFQSLDLPIIQSVPKETAASETAGRRPPLQIAAAVAAGLLSLAMVCIVIARGMRRGKREDSRRP